MTRTIKMLRSQLSVSNALALVALFAALGTGAAFGLPGKNKVDRNDIRKDAVSGKQVVESTLGQVPSAANATNANSANSANSAKSADTAKQADSASVAGNAEAVDGFSLVRKIHTVTLPVFPAGSHLCKAVDVAIPEVEKGDHVVMTPFAEPTWDGNDQVAITVHGIDNGIVEVQGCLSPDAATPVTPTGTNYEFLLIKG